MLKKLTAIILLMMLITSVVGCSKQTSATQSNIQNNTQNTHRQYTQTPESKLRRTVMSIMQIDRSNSAITSDQAQKLIPIIQDIKLKDTIDDTYANAKIDEINAVFTDQQKQSLNNMPRGNRQFGQRNNQNGSNVSDNSNSSGSSSTPANFQRVGRPNGQMGSRQGNGQFQQNPKAFYDQIIALLQQKVSK